nr:NADP-dependent isocitrate dehydrogenase [Pseudomonadota bacterium]
WFEAADLIINSMAKTIADGNVTYDLARQSASSVNVISTSEFGDYIIANIKQS